MRLQLAPPLTGYADAEATTLDWKEFPRINIYANIMRSGSHEFRKINDARAKTPLLCPSTQTQTLKICMLLGAAAAL